ncbi:hypothetical protein EK904_008744 [Melospiza melodia maxima]|nr:hypothetical protein EK904_008744 [Melospiza melodia maxima]
MAELLPVASSSQDCLQEGAAAAKRWFVVSLYGDGLNNEAVKMCRSSPLNYYFSSPPELFTCCLPCPVLPSSFRKQEKRMFAGKIAFLPKNKNKKTKQNKKASSSAKPAQ